MNSLPFFHLSGENAILKQIINTSRQEIYLVNTESLEIIFQNDTAVKKHGSLLGGKPVNVSRLGEDYQLRAFRGLISPLLAGSRNEVVLLTKHRNKSGKYYEVEVSVVRHAVHGLDLLIMKAEPIGDKRKLEWELKIKNEANEKLSFELDKFVYSASHDLLAPISTLKGLLNLIEKEKSQCTRQNDDQDYQKMMVKTVSKLERYIYDMIDFSKNMRQDISTEAVNFKNMISVVLDNQRYTSGYDKLKIHVEIFQEVDFYADENRLMMLLNNLVSNAVKYQQPSIPNPFLHIQIASDAKKATICLKDNGIGIGNESIDRIFEMFYRASAMSNGSGLGLYIVREVVRKLKGKIHVASVIGQGSEFLLEIPNKINRFSVDRQVLKSKPSKTAL